MIDIICGSWLRAMLGDHLSHHLQSYFGWKGIKKGGKAENPALVHKFASQLREGMNDEEAQALVFSVAKENGAAPAALFKDLYTVLIGKPMGPKFGKFAVVAGIGRIKDILGSA